MIGASFSIVLFLQNFIKISLTSMLYLRVMVDLRLGKIRSLMLIVDLGVVGSGVVVAL